MIVVTGASGHVGTNLIPELLARGAKLRILDHEDRGSLDGLDIERVSGDVRDRASLQRAFDGAEVVYHLAAVISICGERRGLVPAVNVEGARNVAEVALECGVRRLVHCCSIHAFQQRPLDRALDENRERVPNLRGRHPAYDRSKAEGEREVRKVIARGLDAVIVHPSGIIGPNDPEPSRMGRVFLDLYHRRLPSLIDGGFDWVDVRDVVSGMIAAAERGRRNESYLLSGHYKRLTELAKIAEGITGVKAPRLVSPIWLAQLGAPFLDAYGHLTGREPLYTRESLEALRANRTIVREKALRELDYQPRPIEVSVVDIYRSFAEQGRIPAGAMVKGQLEAG